MKKFTLILFALILSVIPVNALEYNAPEPPDSAQLYMPDDSESFASGVWFILKAAIKELQPNFYEAGRICLSLIALSLLMSIIKDFSDIAGNIIALVSVVCVATTLLQPANAMIHLGAQTVSEISDYGKLILPVLTASLAAQGGTTSSAALYTGPVLFNTVISSSISKLIVPMIYINIALSIGYSAIGEEMLKKLRDLIKWLITWSLKIALYIFTGYLSITGVVSGTADAAKIKAAKLAVSGMIPIVGNIVSDASETIILSAGVVKNSAGIYGFLAILSIWIGPFIQIGVQYLLLKFTASVCRAFGVKESTNLINDFSGTMGILVAMTGTVCLLFLVSLVCYLKGVG